MNRLGIGICALDAFDNVRHPPVTSPLGIVLSYRSEVEVEVDMLVADTCDLEWILALAPWGGLGK